VLIVCLPTYNERTNVEPMVLALGEVFERLAMPCRVLVVDDGSPDGTGEIAQALADRHSWVDVLHRPRKEGLGRAYLAGFAHALAAGADLIAEIDCDFSHDPNDLTRLVAATDNADVAIGSRYVKGGGTRNWSRLRQTVSRGGCLYAQAILGIGVSDLTGGFKCFRREVLETLPLGSVAAQGYAFQVEVTYRAIRAGFSVAELPIVFSERTSGRSKMSYGIVGEAVWKVPALRIASARGRL
jgi:dolichol-phosphate mannosyltransferase